MSLKKIGALWTKKDKNQKDFYAGTLDLGVLGEVAVMVFPNKKEKPEQPDATIQLVMANNSPEG